MRNDPRNTPPIPAPEATVTATIVERDNGFDVNTTWHGVALDRRVGHAWGLGPKKRDLAERLVRAIEGGVVFDLPEIRTDVNGHTYIHAGVCVYGRQLNADLRRLGY